mgnify:CR=1 FL=1
MSVTGHRSDLVLTCKSVMQKTKTKKLEWNLSTVPGGLSIISYCLLPHLPAKQCTRKQHGHFPEFELGFWMKKLLVLVNKLNYKQES